jgi:hypothetical protein
MQQLSWSGSIKHFVLALLLTYLLSGCAKTTAIVGTSSLRTCDVWRTISWSKKDTDQTIVEVKQNNAGRAAYCEDYHEKQDDRSKAEQPAQGKGRK